MAYRISKRLGGWSIGDYCNDYERKIIEGKWGEYRTKHKTATVICFSYLFIFGGVVSKTGGVKVYLVVGRVQRRMPPLDEREQKKQAVHHHLTSKMHNTIHYYCNCSVIAQLIFPVDWSWTMTILLSCIIWRCRFFALFSLLWFWMLLVVDCVCWGRLDCSLACANQVSFLSTR